MLREARTRGATGAHVALGWLGLFLLVASLACALQCGQAKQEADAASLRALFTLLAADGEEGKGDTPSLDGPPGLEREAGVDLSAPDVTVPFNEAIEAQKRAERRATRYLVLSIVSGLGGVAALAACGVTYYRSR